MQWNFLYRFFSILSMSLSMFICGSIARQPKKRINTRMKEKQSNKWWGGTTLMIMTWAMLQLWHSQIHKKEALGSQQSWNNKNTMFLVRIVFLPMLIRADLTSEIVQEFLNLLKHFRFIRFMLSISHSVPCSATLWPLVGFNINIISRWKICADQMSINSLPYIVTM